MHPGQSELPVHQALLVFREALEFQVVLSDQVQQGQSVFRVPSEYQELSEESPGPISRSFFEKVKEIFG